MAGVDWRLVPAAVLILFALWILAALALACSTRFDMIPTLAICSALFLMGIMSDYLFGRRAEPVWRQDVGQEVNSSRWSERQTDFAPGDHGQVRPGQERQGWQPSERETDQRGGPGAAAGGRDGRRLVGIGALHRDAELAAFLASRCLDTRPRAAFHWGYVGKAFVYVAAYVGAALAAAILLFQERELKLISHGTKHTKKRAD